jgi:hypothetical protein
VPPLSLVEDGKMIMVTPENLEVQYLALQEKFLKRMSQVAIQLHPFFLLSSNPKL